MLRIGGIFLVAALAHAQNWTWRATSPLGEARSDACVVRLADGRVLVSGGSGAGGEFLASTEIYTTAPSESFVAAAPMNAPRSSHGCVLLSDGRVLVAGGGTTGVEVYEPSLDLWSPVDGTVPRKAGTAALRMPDGRVLITGGHAVELEIFNPDTSELTILPVTLTIRDRHSVTMLRDGRVLFAGGAGDQGPLNTAEIFDPDDGEVQTVPALSAPRAGHTATLLLDGRVLLAGGIDGEAEVNTLEVWLPDSNRFEVLPGALKDARQSHVALLVETNGNVLIAGGVAAGKPISTSELFDASVNTVGEAGSLTAPRSSIAAVLLEDGTILASGGRDSEGPSAACGLLPSPSFHFTQPVYHPLERAVVSGSLGITGLNVRTTFDLMRIDATGKSTNVNSRLINTSATLSNGNLPATSVVDVFRDDIGSDFVLTMKSVIPGTQTVTAQVRFSAKLRTTLQVINVSGVTVSSQPIDVRTIITADFGTVTFSGTINLTSNGSSASKAISSVATSFGVDMPLCCPVSRLGTIASLNANYGGNVFLEPSSAAISVLILGAAAESSINMPELRLAAPASIDALVRATGPGDLNGITIPDFLRPTGSVRMSTANGTIIGSPGLQIPPSTVPSPLPGYPFSQATLSYAPTVLDFHAGQFCVTAEYSGDGRYGSTSSRSEQGACRTVKAARSVLQNLTPASSYVFGSSTPLSVRLTWPDSVGIVSRTVTVLADGRSAGTITLVPNAQGLGIADGTSNFSLPFNARNLTFVYDRSGDLDSSQLTVPISMSPVVTSMSSPLAATVSNPFAIPYLLSITTGGRAIPPGTALGGSVEFRDGDVLLGTLPAPTLQSGSGITDGSSNTILPASVSVFGSLPNNVRPTGRRTITIRYTGGPLFQASQVQITPTVQ